MFYLVIDLEMCRVPRDYRNKAYHYAYETIIAFVTWMLIR